MAKPEPVEMTICIKRADGESETMRYSLKPIRSGDNPHQKGYIGEPLMPKDSAITEPARQPAYQHHSPPEATKLGDNSAGVFSSYKEVIPGRGMGFTNHLDLSGYSVAVEISKTMIMLGDERAETVVINKHTNPAVYSARRSQIEALTAALSTDRKSPFGGVAAFSSVLKSETAEFLAKKNRDERFVLDVLAAPGFETGSVETLSSCMKNLRIIDVSPLDTWEKINAGVFGMNMKFTIGGKPVITDFDSTSFFNTKYGMEVLSRRKPSSGEYTDAHLAWIGAKAIQSNSFAFVKDATLLCQCGGQTNREDSAKFAKERADEFGVSLEGCAAATDSFLFDHTSIDLLHGMGVRTVVHPTRKGLTTGNLKPDLQILAKIDEYDMTMLRPYLVGENGQEMPWRVFRHL